MATIAVTNVGRGYSITPEFYFQKQIDNSRLVKVADPARRREMMVLGAALLLLLVVVLLFCWQHFSAIEYGYRNEDLTQQYNQLRETQRHLQAEQATLTSPVRIGDLARQMGLQPPLPGQVVLLESPGAESDGAVLARVSTTANPGF
jgi:cell division protein FtsL